jgi:hypothetical protein
MINYNIKGKGGEAGSGSSFLGKKG